MAPVDWELRFSGEYPFITCATFAGSVMIAGLALLADLILNGIECWLTRIWRMNFKTKRKDI